MDLKRLAELIGTMPGYSAQTPTADVVAWLKEGITVRIAERMVNARTVLSEYPGGPMVAAGVLDALETASQSVSAVKWVMSFLKADGIDIADDATRSAIDALVVGGALTSEQGEHLKAMGDETRSRWVSIGGNTLSSDATIAGCVDMARQEK